MKRKEEREKSGGVQRINERERKGHDRKRKETKDEEINIIEQKC